MATTTISDYVIWTKHIHDDAVLAERLARLGEGETVELWVDGVRGTWLKMKNGADGRPTQGLKPVGRMRTFWSELFKTRRGDVVSLVCETPVATGVVEADAPPFRYDPVAPNPAGAIRRLVRTQADRDAALSALLDGAKSGWRSEGRAMSRDEMHER
ncbi:MAG TPA: hypothetical protein VHY32_05340 [Caulobacteraceae bacterium]|jgi:hypothetical protein|nr:hypothetical protein [Caulobacteraceae bacterium]